MAQKLPRNGLKQGQKTVPVREKKLHKNYREAQNWPRSWAQGSDPKMAKKPGWEGIKKGQTGPAHFYWGWYGGGGLRLGVGEGRKRGVLP